MDKPFSQACENNKQPIFEVISRHFSGEKRVFEVGSGTGQHAVYFAQKMPHLFWQTADLPENHSAINAWLSDSQLENIGAPIPFDVTTSTWPPGFDTVYSANTCHIMPWQAVQHFIPGVAGMLPEGGLFCLYGPFNYRGKFTSESNARFELWLKEQAPHQGIRDFEAVNQLAADHGLELLEDNMMPANNRLLVWQKTAR